jgi:hypothetical protein
LLWLFLEMGSRELLALANLTNNWDYRREPLVPVFHLELLCLHPDIKLSKLHFSHLSNGD